MTDDNEKMVWNFKDLLDEDSNTNIQIIRNT